MIPSHAERRECGRLQRLQATGAAARASTAATLTLVVAGQRSLGSKQQCAIQSLLHRAEAVQHVCNAVEHVCNAVQHVCNGSQGERPVESGPCCAALHSAGCTGAWSANDSPESVRPPARPPALTPLKTSSQPPEPTTAALPPARANMNGRGSCCGTECLRSRVRLYALRAHALRRASVGSAR